jgi:hypothetical protein
MEWLFEREMVEADLGVGEVVDHHQVVLAGEADDALEEGSIHALGGRIVGEGEDQQLGSRPGAVERLLEVGDEVAVRGHRHVAQVATGDDHRVLVDRIGRVGREHDVARPDGHQDEVGEALLRADHGDGLAVRVELDAVASLIPLADRRPQVGDATGGGVAVIALVARRLADLVDDVIGGGQVRVAHAQVDHVLAGAARGVAQLGHLRQHVGRQAQQLREVVSDAVGHGGPDSDRYPLAAIPLRGTFASLAAGHRRLRLTRPGSTS